MSGLQKTVVWLTGIFIAAGVIIYVASNDTSRPDIWAWIKTIVDWAIAAGVGGVAGNLLSKRSFSTQARPQFDEIRDELEQIKQKLP